MIAVTLPYPAADRDRKLLLTATYLRAMAVGLAGVLLGIYLAQADLEPGEIGIVVGAGLAGGAVASLGVTLGANRLRRRTTLIGLAFLSACGGIGLLLTDSPLALALVAFAGMLNGMGRDRGASLIIEQAILPATVEPKWLTRTFARYNVLQDGGQALGGLLLTVPGSLLHISDASGNQVLIVFYALLFLASAVVQSLLSPEVEAGPSRPTTRTEQTCNISPDTKRIVRKISALFLLDSLGGGFLTTALLGYFFFERFGVSASSVGILFFGARVLNALSHFGAAWLSSRIGLVNTMVFTHIPSSLLLVAVAFVPNFTLAATLLLLREGLVEMDVPTRQAYVMAMVGSGERLYAAGVTSIVRMGGWAVAPGLAGFLMQGWALMMPLVAGAALKITYDLLLYRNFKHLKPAMER
ncbi:MAG: MFS transporter [Calditrichaeota bacterium]|nr:MFS transporter [Calditrichota bacterium]